ncbi:MAG: alpha/beta hydrolase [Bifidobacteriaceae bacterium]|jgi:pimeloyl-ACP methyl ester carboxylesterase|nr:alpha/beta hydrolase [Bifidobacteriaceae bacterium]
MTLLAVRGAGSLAGIESTLDKPSVPDRWAQDDETSPFPSAGRSGELADRPLVPPGTVPLVLLHAFPLSSVMWRGFSDDLPELPILEIDLPGAGLSPCIEPVTLTAAGLAVATSLQELGVTRAVVAGVSMGGYVAMRLLMDHPELTVGLALMHTKATADSDDSVRARLNVAREVMRTGSVGSLRPMAGRMISAESAQAQPGLVERVEGWIGEASPAGVAWAEEAMASRQDSMALLRAAGLPSMVVAGELDPFSSLTDSEAMVTALGPRANLVVLAGVGHLSPLETTHSMARTMREFYRRCIGWP